MAQTGSNDNMAIAALLRQLGLYGELIDVIMSMAGLLAHRDSRQQSVDSLLAQKRNRHPAEDPIADGSCPLLERLPFEARKAIFFEWLPSKDAIITPQCKDAISAAAKPGEGPKHNGTSDLMTLNKQICSELAEVVYEERTFEIHVHEGLKDGGIEFINAGRQPLQYKDTSADTRFWKFKTNDAFGFDRLKKIKIIIFPANDDCKHNSINTYFMNSALCRMLERPSDDGKNRIKSLDVSFAAPNVDASRLTTRRAIQRAEHYWWDPDSARPRETSVHNLPNVQLVLRAFTTLTDAHNVSINLPVEVSSDIQTASFVSRLEASMRSKDGTEFTDDNLDFKIETARSALEEYILRTLYSGQGTHVPRMGERDLAEDCHNNDDDSDDNNDDGDEGGGGDPSRKGATKHGLSPTSKNMSSKGKRQQTWASSNVVSLDEGMSLTFGSGPEKEEYERAILRSVQEESLRQWKMQGRQLIELSPAPNSLDYSSAAPDAGPSDQFFLRDDYDDDNGMPDLERRGRSKAAQPKLHYQKTTFHLGKRSMRSDSKQGPLTRAGARQAIDDSDADFPDLQTAIAASLAAPSSNHCPMTSGSTGTSAPFSAAPPQPSLSGLSAHSSFSGGLYGYSITPASNRPSSSRGHFINLTWTPDNGTSGGAYVFPSRSSRSTTQRTPVVAPSLDRAQPNNLHGAATALSSWDVLDAPAAATASTSIWPALTPTAPNQSTSAVQRQDASEANGLTDDIIDLTGDDEEEDQMDRIEGAGSKLWGRC